MNPGIPPRLDSERSPVKAGELEGRGSDKRRGTEKEGGSVRVINTLRLCVSL